MAASNPLNSPGAQDPGAASGDWLFRHAELVLGPVPAPQIIEKLYSGELSGQSEVARAGSSEFRRISELDSFRFHLARAEAKLRVDAAAAADHAKARKGRNIRLAIVAGIGLVATGSAIFAARHLAVHNPWKEEVDEFAGISVEAPVIGLARNRASDEELIEYPGLVPGIPTKTGSTPTALAGKDKTSGKTDTGKTGKTGKLAANTATKTGKTGGGMSRAEDEPDGMQMATFDLDGINAVVKAKTKTLFPCLQSESKRRPGFTAKVPIEFVIGNDGKVAKLWVDHPELKKGELADCMLEELQKWRFKPYEGERATVGLAFKIGG